MTFTTLRHRTEDGVLHVTLARPDELNSFTVTMADELEQTFLEASADDSVRAVVMSGEGRAFCAGMDLSVGGNVFGLDESMSPTLADMQDLEEQSIKRGVRDTGGRVTLAIHECTKPVIAAINGPAVGIGATMTLAMDVRMASTKARIGLVFGRIGITPEACSTWFLPRIVGMAQALELVYSADILSADQALAVGLVTEVHEPERLLEAAHDKAVRWTSGRSAVATAMARQMMYRNSAAPHPVDAHRVDSLSMFYTSIADGAEGVRAFVEKREPQYRSSVPQDLPPFYDEWVDAGSKASS